MKQLFWLILGAILGWCICTIVNNPITRYNVEQRTEYDTVTIYDTIRHIQPVPKDTLIRRYVTDTLRLAADTTERVNVEIPIIQTLYAGDNYKAWVSGYHTNLDSLDIYAPTTIVTKTETTIIPQKTDFKRWSVGIQAGYGITPKGMQPYFGVGIIWRIKEF